MKAVPRRGHRRIAGRQPTDGPAGDRDRLRPVPGGPPREAGPRPPGGESEAASDGDEPAPTDYDEDPYAGYRATDGFGLAAHRRTGEGREWSREDLAPKAVVLGVERGDEALGFPLPWVERTGGVVRATVGDEPVLAVVADGIHSYRAPDFELRMVDGRLRGDGTTWDGATGRAVGGRRLSRLPARRLFAFAWRDDHGPDAFDPA